MAAVDLLGKFATVVRATVEGNIALAAARGGGGLIFAVLGIEGSLLWAVLMSFLSSLPAIGSALVRALVGDFILIGAEWKNRGLGYLLRRRDQLVDNILRPLFVGKDVGMPDRWRSFEPWEVHQILFTIAICRDSGSHTIQSHRLSCKMVGLRIWHI